MAKLKISPEQMRAVAHGLRAVVLAVTDATRSIADFIEHCDDDQLRALVASLENEDDE